MLPHLLRLSSSFSSCRDSIESALFSCDARHTEDDQNEGNFDSIFLGSHHIGNKGVARIVDGLEDYIHYRKLFLCDNRITQDGAALISQSLRCNTTLVELSLGDNSIGDEGVFFISASLKENCTLEILNLENNGISCKGIGYIVDAMLYNTVIQHLVLSQNPIEDVGAKALLRCIRDNSSLANLYLSNHTLLSIILKKVTLVKDGRILRDIKSYLKVNRMADNVHVPTRKILHYIRETPHFLIDYIFKMREDNNNPDLALCLMPRILSLIGSHHDLATINIILQTSPSLFWRGARDADN